MTAQEAALSVRDLSVEYVTSEGATTVVHEVSFDLLKGRILGVAGESGSGKTTAALASLGWRSGLQRRRAGSSNLAGVDLFDLDDKALRQVWGRQVGYVPQEIGGALHPAYRLRTQFRETLRANVRITRGAADRRALELLSAARIPSPKDALRRYPHEFSGGQLQRIAIALALAPHPEVLILDEPTTGLDVTTQRAVVGVLADLVKQEDVGALFITHDLALLSELADDILILYAGQVVERGPTASVVAAPKHPYTRAILDAVPSAQRAITPRGIQGLPPGRVLSDQCAFAERCSYAVEQCWESAPPLTEAVEAQRVRCWRADELTLESAAGETRVFATVASGVPVIDARHLCCVYGSGRQQVQAVADVSIAVPHGAVAGVVGESGSGKSTLGSAIAGIMRPESGSILLNGEPLPRDPRRRTREQRRAIQIIFQNPAASLNPRRTIGDHLAHIAAKFVEGSANDRRAVIEDTLSSVQLSIGLLNRFPSQLSGGQQQRVAIAAAFMAHPRLVICDEITSGQDVSVQAAILRMLANLQARSQTAVLFISHDLGVVRSIADHIYVMQEGRVVEDGPCETVFMSPEHSYTRELLAAVPEIGPQGAEHLESR